MKNTYICIKKATGCKMELLFNFHNCLIKLVQQKITLIRQSGSQRKVLKFGQYFFHPPFAGSYGPGTVHTREY